MIFTPTYGIGLHPERLSPEYVYDLVLLHYDSWEAALRSRDGSAVIRLYLGYDYEPPETEGGGRRLTLQPLRHPNP
jgi:hypothetical protein